MRKIPFYGYRPDLADVRDLWLGVENVAVPPSVNLSQHLPPVMDQGELGSCTANAISAALQTDEHIQEEQVQALSRLFIYYQERALEGTTGSDSGAAIRDGIKVVSQQGAPPETDWPYEIDRFAQKPPQKAYQDAQLHRALLYRRVGRAQMRQALAAGFPVVIGFSVYESFESDEVAKTGVVPMPGPGEQLLGGHAVLVHGYDDATQRFSVRNSWGEGWGHRGDFYWPYAYALDPNLSSDFWSVTRVS